jgi:hypothetical protein
LQFQIINCYDCIDSLKIELLNINITQAFQTYLSENILIKS